MDFVSTFKVIFEQLFIPPQFFLGGEGGKLGGGGQALSGKFPYLFFYFFWNLALLDIFGVILGKKKKAGHYSPKTPSASTRFFFTSFCLFSIWPFCQIDIKIVGTNFRMIVVKITFFYCIKVQKIQDLGKWSYIDLYINPGHT